jgi:hypothetical protein
MLLKQVVNHGAGWASGDSFPAGPELNGAGCGVERIGYRMNRAQLHNEAGPRLGKCGRAAHGLLLEEGREGGLDGARVFGLVASLPSYPDPLECRFLRRIEGVDQLPINPDLVLGGVHRFLHALSIGTMFANVKGEF